VDSLAGDFEPEKYSDTYRQAVLELIERKAQGKQIAVQPTPEAAAAPAPDLMSALKASLDAVRAREGGGAPKRGKPKAAGGKAGSAKAAAKKPAVKKPAASRPSAKR
jgi:DNA end-binding protein Ku